MKNREVKRQVGDPRRVDFPEFKKRIYACPKCLQSWTFTALNGPAVPEHKMNGKICAGSNNVPVRARRKP